jgi:hypothetical protein
MVSACRIMAYPTVPFQAYLIWPDDTFNTALAFGTIYAPIVFKMFLFAACKRKKTSKFLLIYMKLQNKYKIPFGNPLLRLYWAGKHRRKRTL